MVAPPRAGARPGSANGDSSSVTAVGESTTSVSRVNVVVPAPGSNSDGGSGRRDVEVGVPGAPAGASILSHSPR